MITNTRMTSVYFNHPVLFGSVGPMFNIQEIIFSTWDYQALAHFFVNNMLKNKCWLSAYRIPPRPTNVGNLTYM